MTEPAHFNTETSFVAERLREMGFSGAALTHRLERRSERLMALLAHVETTDCRDMCAMQSIEDIVSTAGIWRTPRSVRPRARQWRSAGSICKT